MMMMKSRCNTPVWQTGRRTPADGYYAQRHAVNKNLSWCWEICVTRYYPEGGKLSATGWPPYRGGSINVSAGRRVVQRVQTENFQVHPSDRLPFPLEFRNHNAVLENHSGMAIRPRKKFDDIFSRLDSRHNTGVWHPLQTSSQPSFDSNYRVA